MRVVIDYRPALRDRTGVGEYVHQIARALGRGLGPTDEIRLFTSSLKDRPDPKAIEELGRARLIDRRIPVRILNLAWHRFEWPPIEALAQGPFDIAHSPHPLLMPSVQAAQVVTIHDLHFLDHPDHTQAEIRRDYRALARRHAERADMIIVPSPYMGRSLREKLGVTHDRIAVCCHGRPDWGDRVAESREPQYLLFFGTLEPRKNIGVLLDAYEQLIRRRSDVPELVLAGRSTTAARDWLNRLSKPPLANRVRYLGYVNADDRPELYRRAHLLALPSLDEGFGMPALEAMACGVPVVASSRGALPEIVGDAGLLVDPDDPDAIATALERLLADETLATTSAARGLQWARAFSWDATAEALCRAYERAIAHHATKDPARRPPGHRAAGR